MMNTELIVAHEGGLQREVWTFYFMDNRTTLYVDHYAVEVRETTRHKFKPTKRYYRLDQRNNNITASEVPLTETIKGMAIAAFTKSLQVKMWE